MAFVLVVACPRAIIQPALLKEENLMQDPQYMVAIVGAGPAGLFAARKLAEGGHAWCCLYRDINRRLGEYGIYPDKLKNETGFARPIQQILDLSSIDLLWKCNCLLWRKYRSGRPARIRFQAVLITTGPGHQMVRLPGENLPGVYHAKNIIFHYNLLPPFSEKNTCLGTV